MKIEKSETKSSNIFQAFIQIIPKIVRVSPMLFLCGFMLNVLDGVSFGLMTPIMQLFMDQATNFAAQKTGIMNVVSALILLGVCYTFKNALNGVAYVMNMFNMRRAEGALSEEIHEKISRIAPIFFENTQILDDINKAVEGKDCANRFANSVLLSLNVYIPYFISMAVYLSIANPVLAVSLLFVFIPTLLTQIFRAKLFAKVENKAVEIRREFNYYEDCMVGREYFKETRINGAFSFFNKLYINSLSLLNKLTFQASIKSNLAELGTKLLSVGGYIGILLLLFDSLMKRKISVGAFAAIFASVGQMFSMMEDVICKQYGSVACDFGKVQNYLKFLQIPEREGEDVELAPDADITLRNVSITYPGAKQKAVQNVNITIRHGETIALVGENGSGKSTLVRLITGIYQPDEGEVRYGDTNINAVSAISTFKNISAVFQKYQRYQMPLRDNIGISNVREPASNVTLDKVCVQAGIDKNDNSLNNGYDTMLSREFDGVDLSGGQWQRVAIARSFFRTHRFIVLDEPTAAIDPVEETKIYNGFGKISRGKTCVIVTHRLGSVRFADRIFVMKHGKLVEQGTHEELLATQGEYSRLYMSQEQWYRDECKIE